MCAPGHAASGSSCALPANCSEIATLALLSLGTSASRFPLGWAVSMRQTLKSCVTIPARLESNSQESLSRRHCSQKSRWTVWRHARKPTKPELAHDLSPANSLQAPASCAHVSQWSCGYNTDVSLCFLSWQDQRRCRACLVHSHPGDLLQKANLSLGGDGLGVSFGKTLGLVSRIHVGRAQAHAPIRTPSPKSLCSLLCSPSV